MSFKNYLKYFYSDEGVNKDGYNFRRVENQERQPMEEETVNDRSRIEEEINRLEEEFGDDNVEDEETNSDDYEDQDEDEDGEMEEEEMDDENDFFEMR